jgi:serine protease AprX
MTAEARARVRAKVLPIVTPEHDALTLVVEGLGGKVTERLIGISALIAEVPVGALPRLAADTRVHRIFKVIDPKPCLDMSVPYLGVPGTFWANNITGQTWDAGMIDTGCQQNHPCFASITFDTAPGVPATDPGSGGGHGTSVAGIICSGDATHRGVAPGLDRLLVGTLSNAGSHSDWMVTTAADDPEVMNHSWGTSIANSDDAEYEQFYDALADDFDCAQVFATGNDGENGNPSTLTRPSNARNIISVGNMFIFNTVDPADDRLMDTSGQGPVPGLNRKKPDLVAPGEGTTSANYAWATLPDFDYFSGTSAAAPHVSGGYLLVLQARADQTPYANKAVLINAADAWSESGTNSNFLDDEPYSGSLWNNAYGWGTMNLGSAYYNATDVFESSVSTIGAATSERLYAGTLFNGEKATLVWHRSMVYHGTMIPPDITPLRDLDLRLYRQSDGALIDSSLSSVDNVEQVGINAPPAGNDPGTPVVIKVTMDTANASAAYALATEENFVETAGPGFATSRLTSECGPQVGFFLHVTVTNNGGATAHNVIATLDPMPAGWIVTSSLHNVGAIPPGESRYARFAVIPPCATGTANVSWVVSSSSYGKQFAATGSGTITINPAAPIFAETPQLFFAQESSANLSFNAATNEFQVVAARPGGADWALYIDSGGPCNSGPLASSFPPGPPVQFVLMNTNQPSVPDSGPMMAGILLIEAQNVLSNARVEYEPGFDFAAASTTTSFDLEEVIEVFEKPLTAGIGYRVRVEVLTGSSDLALYVFPPSTTYANQDDALVSLDAAGPGGTESTTFVAPATGTYGFIVAKNNLGSGNIRLTVTCAADFNNSGTVTVQDIFDFLSDWNSQVAGGPVIIASADFNNSGTITVQDIFDYLAAWNAGC